MEFNSYRVDSIDEAQVQHQELYRIVAYDGIDDTLSFDAIVIVAIDISNASSH